MRGWVAGALAVAALLVWGLVLRGPKVPPDAPSATGRRVGAERLGEPPPSLRGTRARGRLELDGEGHFVPGPGALALFEYHLSAIHERPLDELRLRVVADLRQRLAAPAAAEAEAFLDRYLDYRAELGDEARYIAPGDLEGRFENLRALRREHFGSELAEELFGVEERSIAVQLERRRVLADPTLAEDERRMRLGKLEAELPEEVRETRARARAPLEAWQAEQALRESGASPAEIEALRERALGPEAAARLRALDAERAAWEARLEVYRNERDRLHEALGDRPDDLAEATRALREREFEPDERARVELLDAVERVRAPDAPAP